MHASFTFLHYSLRTITIFSTAKKCSISFGETKYWACNLSVWSLRAKIFILRRIRDHTTKLFLKVSKFWAKLTKNRSLRSYRCSVSFFCILNKLHFKVVQDVKTKLKNETKGRFWNVFVVRCRSIIPPIYNDCIQVKISCTNITNVLNHDLANSFDFRNFNLKRGCDAMDVSTFERHMALLIGSLTSSNDLTLISLALLKTFSNHLNKIWQSSSANISMIRVLRELLAHHFGSHCYLKKRRKELNKQTDKQTK